MISGELIIVAIIVVVLIIGKTSRILENPKVFVKPQPKTPPPKPVGRPPTETLTPLTNVNKSNPPGRKRQ